MGGGPNTLPAKFHTVIDVPGAVKRANHNNSSNNADDLNASNKSNHRKSPLGWKALFGGGRGRAKAHRRTTTDLKNEQVGIFY